MRRTPVIDTSPQHACYKRASPWSSHPQSYRAVLAWQRYKGRQDRVIKLSGGPGACEHDMRGRRRVDFQGYLQNELLISRERAEFGGIVVINTQGVIRHQIDVQEPMAVVSDRLNE